MTNFYNNLKTKVLLSLFIVFISLSGYCATYYVSSTGSDSNSGLSSSSPWKTIAKVNSSTFVAGDQVLFQKGGTWAETLNVPSSGSSTSPITFGVYGTGNKPVITGSDTRAYTVNTNNKTYVTIDGFNLVHAVPSSFEGSINVGSSTVQGVVIRNCTIENNRRCGIVLKGTSQAANVTIDNCIIQNNGQFGILVTSGYSSGQISNCQLLGNGWAADQDAQQFSNIQGILGNLNIYGNTITNAAPGSVNYTTKSHGIYVSTATTNAANIHDNLIYGNLTGAGIKARFSANIYNNTIYGNEIECINPGGNGTTNAVYNIHHNILYGSVSGFPGIFESEKGSGSITLNIYNNTFYKSGTAYSSTKEVGISDNLTSLTIKNNIFYAANGGISVASQSNALIDYNLYWRDAASGAPNNIYNGTTYSTMASWKSAGFDSHGINANPLFVGPTSNFQLQSTSPAINTGVNVGLTADYNGNTLVGSPDMGAFESGSSVSVDVTIPIVSAFTIPATATSLTVPISTFTATDNIGVTGYLLTETSSTPSVSVSGWSSTKPTSYSFSTIGTKTLYAWAKDGAGNVSASRTATINITNPADVTIPIVSAFTIPATATSLTVPISTFTATDNIGVTGYLLTETSSTPSASVFGWSSTKPTSYSFSTIGTKTLYAWAKDGAGNVSASRNAIVVISSAVATSFSFTGPTSGNVNSTSTNFTVTPNNFFTGTITITPTGTGSIGLSAKVLTFSNSSTAQTFTITPTIAGSITLVATNSGSLSNPASITYTSNAVNNGSANLGYNVKGSSVYSSVAGAMNASQFTASSSFIATTMYVSMAAVNSKIKGAIYSDNGGNPGNKLGETVILTNPTVGGFQKLTGLNVSIQSGTKYWLVVWSSAAIKIDVATSGGIFKWKASNTYSNWWSGYYQRSGYLPSTFPTPDGSSSIKCSIYVDGGLKEASLNEDNVVITGIEKLPEIVKIDVFPNPSFGNVTVRFSILPDAGSRIDILDISGRQITTRLIKEEAEVFNLENQPAGMYFIKMILGSKETTQKLIINK